MTLLSELTLTLPWMLVIFLFGVLTGGLLCWLLTVIIGASIDADETAKFENPED